MYHYFPAIRRCIQLYCWPCVSTWIWPDCWGSWVVWGGTMEVTWQPASVYCNNIQLHKLLYIIVVILLHYSLIHINHYKNVCTFDAKPCLYSFFLNYKHDQVKIMGITSHVIWVWHFHVAFTFSRYQEHTSVLLQKIYCWNNNFGRGDWCA